MQYAQLPPNPYVVPPMASYIDPTGHHPKVRIWFLITALISGTFYVSGIGLFVGAFAVHDHDLSPVLAVAGWAVILLGAMLIYVKLGLALYWLHGAWKWVPMDQRFTRDGKRIGPGEVFMLLIPYYHFYWMFPVNMGLCDTMERLRAHYLRGQPVPPTIRDKAMWAAICELIPFANFFLAPFMWSSYMKRIDEMHEEIAAAVGGAA